MSEKVIITFLKSWRGYGVGETAGFDPAVAKDLVSGGVAEKYKPVEADKSGAPVKKGGRAANAGAAGNKSSAAPENPPPPEDPGSGGGDGADNGSSAGGPGDDDESKP